MASSPSTDLSTRDLTVVQVGVGSFGAAVVSHLRTSRIARVEPTAAPLLLPSLAVGQRVLVPGPHDSIMPSLNCGMPSMLAWPVLAAGSTGAVVVAEEQARDRMRSRARN